MYVAAMYRFTALFTAAALLLVSPAAQASTLDDGSTTTKEIRVIESGSGTDGEGRRFEFELWTDGNSVYGDARVTEPDGDYLEFWREGDVIFYEGKMDGEPAFGEMPAKFEAPNDDEPVCAGWVALICIGVAILAGAGGCATFDGCLPEVQSQVPGGQGGGGGDDGDEEPTPPGGGDAE